MWRSLGRITVTTTGTPVQVTTDHEPCQTLFFQQWQTNTGKLYVCDRADAVIATGVGVVAIIPAPTLNEEETPQAAALPYASVTIPTGPNSLNAKFFYIDADVSGEFCLVSLVRG